MQNLSGIRFKFETTAIARNLFFQACLKNFCGTIRAHGEIVSISWVFLERVKVVGRALAYG
jgi:hypothetical protein